MDNGTAIRVMPCEVFSRIVGYYRPVQGWNDGKRAEYRDRKMVDLKPMIAEIEKEDDAD
jgi:anaerobic ribonucleoside-triphosphate reductase